MCSRTCFSSRVYNVPDVPFQCRVDHLNCMASMHVPDTRVLQICSTRWCWSGMSTRSTSTVGNCRCSASTRVGFVLNSSGRRIIGHGRTPYDSPNSSYALMDSVWEVVYAWTGLKRPLTSLSKINLKATSFVVPFYSEYPSASTIQLKYVCKYKM
jgi:hypothetical protein